MLNAFPPFKGTGMPRLASRFGLVAWMQVLVFCRGGIRTFMLSRRCAYRIALHALSRGFGCRRPMEDELEGTVAIIGQRTRCPAPEILDPRAWNSETVCQASLRNA